MVPTVRVAGGADGTVKGMTVSENAMGFVAVRLHYSCDPSKDVTHPDEKTRDTSREWLASAQRTLADPNLWAQEMEINWFVSTGLRVYPEFQESLHAPFPLVPNPRKVLYRAWDFGWHAPACLIASIDTKDRLLVLREVVGRELSTRDFAQLVVDRCAEWYPNHSPGWQDFCDPAGQQVKSMESERSEKRDIEVLNSLSIFPSWDYGWSRKDGRALIHQLLVLRTDQTPSMFLDGAGCPTLLQAFLGKYVYPERKDGQARDEPEEDNHPWSDVQAALRYLTTGLYTALGLRRFKWQPVLVDKKPVWHGYGTKIRNLKRA